MPKSGRRTSKERENDGALASNHNYNGMELSPVTKKPTLSNDLINSRSDAPEKMLDAVRTEIRVINEKIILVEKWVEENELRNVSPM